MANSYKMTRLNSGDRKISSETWNGFVQMYEDSRNRTNVSGDPLKRPIPPILNGSTIALATLKKGQDAIDGYQPVRITEIAGTSDIALGLPLYEVEAVDALDASGEPTERHGNYAFTMAEGISKQSGGRIIVAGLAVVSVARNQVSLDAASMPVTEAVKQSYYMIPDKTLSDVTDVLLAPVGHFKLVSWHDAAKQTAGRRVNDKIFLLVDMSKRPTVFTATTDGTVPASSEASGVTTLSSTRAFTYYLTGGSETLKRIDVEKDDQNYEILTYNTTDASMPAGEYMVSYSPDYNRFVILAGGGGGEGGGTGVGYMVETGAAGLVAGVAQDLAVYEASSENDLPTNSGTTKRVTHTWATDLGATIPSNVRMMVVECSDGFSRPIYIDHSWIYNTSMVQRWMSSSYASVINSGHLNNGWGTIIMTREKLYGYGMASTGSGSMIDVLRTGSYNISVQWTGFTHVLDATLRISDHSGALQSQLFNSGTSANGGYMLEENYTVTQAMLNSGGVSLLLEASYTGNSTSGATSWENFTFNVERVGD